MATRYPDQPQPVDSIEDEINRFFDRIVECVDHRRRALIAEVREKREERRARLVEKQESERQLLEAKAETERNVKENVLQEIKEDIIAKIEKKLSEVRLQEAETRLVFQGDSRQLEEMILGLGEVLEQEIPVIPRYQDLRVTVAVGKEGDEDGNICNPKAIAIDNNTNNIYIAQGGSRRMTIFMNARVSIFSETGVFLNSFGQQRLKDPHGIAIDGNYVYVTDWGTHRVYQFKQETNIRLVNSVGGFGFDNGKFDHPSQVCISTNGNVYVTDLSQDHIQILNNSLRFLRSLSLLSLTAPRDIKITEDEIYVLSTDDSDCIHVFSHNGENIRSIITRGEGKQVRWAHYFCMDANKNIIISDYLDNCVKVFSNEGTLLHTISKQGHEKGTLVYPQGIAQTKDLKLAVVSGNQNFGLQIFYF